MRRMVPEVFYDGDSMPVPETAAPTGLIALVFTDVQGSTQLWESDPEGMRAALDLHNAVMRETIAETRGYEIKTEGDAFILAFADALDAVRFCLVVQERLVAAAWPDALIARDVAAEESAPDGRRIRRGLRVRMGVHLGEPVCRPDPVTGRMDYFGPVMNRAARVAAAGHGGQILLSERTWKAIEPRLDALGKSVVADLGDHRLKDLESAERLRQLVPASLVGRTFPPLRTLDARKTNLSAHPTPFIGREADLATLHELLQRERLVTVLGPGGTGKTRLTMRYAALHLDAFSGDGAGGVWFCDLTEARSLDGVCAAVGRALAVPLTTGKTSADTVAQLGHAIAGRGRVLLVLDNFEQVVSTATDTVAKWLAAAPEARFLISSQERLKLPGEAMHELTPLSVPDDPGRAADSEAVQLFVQRARAVRREWSPSATDLPAIAEIVRALDGIPLAIELAAARIGVLPPAKILERLPRRFELLGGARRDATARQATLRGAIDWSWSLLRDHEKDALAQCSVFQGGFSLEAAEEVLDLSAHAGAPWALDVVQSLRDKSLLRATEPGEFPGELRFGMYNNIREYAAEKLVESGCAADAVDRHAAHFLKVGSEWAKGVETHGGNERMSRLALDLENLAAILQRESGLDPATVESSVNALRAVLALDPVLSSRGPFGVHLGWLDAALAAAERADAPVALTAEAYEARGRARRVRGRTHEALADLGKARQLAADAGVSGVEARALAQIGFTFYQQGKLDDAKLVLDEGLKLATGAGDRATEGRLLNFRASVSLASGNEIDALRQFEAARKLAREDGNRRAEGAVTTNLALLHRKAGRHDDALALYRDALAAHREVANRSNEGNALGGMAGVLMEQERFDEARRCYEDALETHRLVGNLGSLAFFHGNLGVLLHFQGELVRSSEALSRCIELFRSLDDARHQGLYLGYLAATDVARSELATANVHFAEARALVSGHAEYSAAVEILGCLTLENGEAVRRLAELVDVARAGAKSLWEASEDVRLAHRIALLRG